MICLDEMGPVAAKSDPGQDLVRPGGGGGAARASQEIDYGRRGKDYVYGDFAPASGEALTAPYEGRTTANWVDFLGQVEAWPAAAGERVYATLDNLSRHRAPDVLLFALAHPRWEFVFRPTYAAYPNLIELWWKVLRSLALKGQRFETWEEACHAVAAGPRYWHAHRHPFAGGRRRRHKARRRGGLRHTPLAA